jgi:hypothetical protein
MEYALILLGVMIFLAWCWQAKKMSEPPELPAEAIDPEVHAKISGELDRHPHFRQALWLRLKLVAVMQNFNLVERIMRQREVISLAGPFPQEDQWYLTLVGEEFDGWYVSGMVGFQKSDPPYQRTRGLLLQQTPASNCLWTFPAIPNPSYGRYFFRNAESGKYLTAAEPTDHRLSDSPNPIFGGWDFVSVAEDRTIICNPNWRYSFFESFCLKVIKGHEGIPILTFSFPGEPPNDTASLFKLTQG